MKVLIIGSTPNCIKIRKKITIVIKISNNKKCSICYREHIANVALIFIGLSICDKNSILVIFGLKNMFFFSYISANNFLQKRRKLQ